MGAGTPLSEPDTYRPGRNGLHTPERRKKAGDSFSLHSATVEALKRKLRSRSYTSHGQDPRQLFSMFDRDNSGLMDATEFAAALRKGGQITADMMSNADLDRLFSAVDADGGGTVSIDELTEFLWGHDSEAPLEGAALFAVIARKAGEKARAESGRAFAIPDEKGCDGLFKSLAAGEQAITRAEFEAGVARLPPFLRCRTSLQRAFTVLDAEGDGTVARHDFRRLLEHAWHFKGMASVFEGIDVDSDGRIDREEFVEACAALVDDVSETAAIGWEAELDRVFDQIDTDGGGFLRFGELCSWASRHLLAPPRAQLVPAAAEQDDVAASEERALRAREKRAKQQRAAAKRLSGSSRKKHSTGPSQPKSFKSPKASTSKVDRDKPWSPAGTKAPVEAWGNSRLGPTLDRPDTLPQRAQRSKKEAGPAAPVPAPSTAVMDLIQSARLSEDGSAKCLKSAELLQRGDVLLLRCERRGQRSAPAEHFARQRIGLGAADARRLCDRIAREQQTEGSLAGEEEETDFRFTCESRRLWPQLPHRVEAGLYEGGGVCAFIATDRDREDWLNPHAAGRLVVHMSSVFCGSEAGLVQGPDPTGPLRRRKARQGESCTADRRGSWVMVDLCSRRSAQRRRTMRRLLPTHYALRNGSLGRRLGRWQLQAANEKHEGLEEPGEWHVLHEGSGMPAEDSVSADWTVEGVVEHFRFFRIVQIGKNLRTADAHRPTGGNEDQKDESSLWTRELRSEAAGGEKARRRAAWDTDTSPPPLGARLGGAPAAVWDERDNKEVVVPLGVGATVKVRSDTGRRARLGVVAHHDRQKDLYAIELTDGERLWPVTAARVDEYRVDTEDTDEGGGDHRLCLGGLELYGTLRESTSE